MDIARKLRAFDVYVDGRGHQGQADEIELPKVTVKTEEYQAGGMDAPVEVDMGLEALTVTLTFGENLAANVGHLGLIGDDVGLTARGAQGSGANTQTIIVDMRGRFKEMDMGTWKRGDQATMKLQAALTYYKLTINDQEVIEIDIPNMVRRIGGVDQMTETRAALGY